MKKIALILCMSLCCALLLPACGKKSTEPITLTVWHVYGGQTDSPLNDLIDQYNQTEGAKNGVNVQVTSVSNTNTIHEAVLAAANGEPGAAELPDLFISYPKTVAALPDKSILADFRDYFSADELSAYIPSFLEDGTVDGRLVIFPVAKSTEVLFVDKTLFDRFAADTGARLEDLSTWEGLYSTADKYTAWTDAQTPDVPNDGKAFFTHDYPFDYFQVGAQSLGEDFFKNGAVNFGPAMERAWDTVSGAAVRGGVWLKDGYATDPMRTGEVAASVASSASVLYYRDIVTYPDNTSENIKIITLPCPVFEGGEKLVMQRGAGFCLVKSTQEREKAACDFLRWLTEPERNTQFVTSAGYLPVTQEAFDTCLAPAVEKLTDEKYRSLYSVILQMQRDYTFYTPPQLETYIAEEDALQSGFRQTLSEARNEYVAQGGQKGGASAESLGKAAYEKLLLSMGNYAAG